MYSSTEEIIIALVTDLVFSISFPLFYSSVLSMRFGKLKFMTIVPTAFMLLTLCSLFIDIPQFVMFFSGIFIMIGSVFIFSNDKTVKKLMYVFIPYIVNIITSLIYFFLRSIFMPDMDMIFGSSNWIDTIFTLIGIVFPLYLISKWINRKKPDVSSLTVIYVLSMFTVQMIILTFIMYVYSTEMNTFVFMSAIMIYTIIFLLLTLFIIRYSIRIGREQSRNELIANRYEQLSAQYAQLRSSYVGYKKLRHDLKDHIRVINGLSLRGNTEELSEYTKKLVEDWDSLSSRTFCDVPAVDIVLAEKYSLAASSGIKTDFMINGISEIDSDPIYLCSIFSNLLNNALEAALHCDNEPFINLQVGIKIDRLVIKCQNSMPSSDIAKSDTENHGYGLHIIKELSELLGGNFVYEHNSAVFTAVVTIPMKMEEK